MPYEDEFPPINATTIDQNVIVNFVGAGKRKGSKQYARRYVSLFKTLERERWKNLMAPFKPDPWGEGRPLQISRPVNLVT